MNDIYIWYKIIGNYYVRYLPKCERESRWGYPIFILVKTSPGHYRDVARFLKVKSEVAK